MKSTEKIEATVYGVTYTAVKYKYMHFLLYVFYIKKNIFIKLLTKPNGDLTRLNQFAGL